MNTGAENERPKEIEYERGGYRILTISPEDRAKERQIVANLQRITDKAKRRGYTLLLDLSHFYPGGKVPRRIQEAADYSAALESWAAMLQVQPQRLDRIARSLAEKGELSCREALDRIGRAASESKRQEKLSELPLIGQIYKKRALLPYNNREWRRRMKRRLKSAKRQYRGKN